MKKTSATVIASLVLLTCTIHAEVLYTNDFQKAEIGKVPDDLMVLDGQFTVHEEGTNKLLELPGTPTDTYTVMFGPSTNANGVSARVFATSKGRRMPAFSIALNGVGGYKLQVSPAKKAIELLNGDTVVQTSQYTWKSGEWTDLNLTASTTDSGIKLLGKVSQSGTNSIEISFNENAKLDAGKASISGTPFAGTPIRFDDLSVFSVK